MPMVAQLVSPERVLYEGDAVREPSDPLTITASPAVIAPRTSGSSVAESSA